MPQIAIETYKDTPIVFDTTAKRFEAVIDGDTVSHAALLDLYDQLDRIEEQQQIVARKAQKPVPALVLMEEQYGTFTLQPCTVLGIHAGRTHHKAVRALVGDTKASLDIGYYDPHLIALHPCDPRAGTIQAHITAIAEAHARLDAAQSAFKDFKATLPSVYVPTVETKEKALQEEPAFLAALQEAITTALAIQDKETRP